MSEAVFVETVWDMLPAETRFRIEKLAASEKKSLADVIVSLLSSGVSTLTPFFMPVGC